MNVKSWWGFQVGLGNKEVSILEISMSLLSDNSQPIFEQFFVVGFK